MKNKINRIWLQGVDLPEGIKKNVLNAIGRIDEADILYDAYACGHKLSDLFGSYELAEILNKLSADGWEEYYSKLPDMVLMGNGDCPYCGSWEAREHDSDYINEGFGLVERTTHEKCLVCGKIYEVK